MNHLEFTHHNLREEEGTVVTASLSATKRIVEVCAINRKLGGFGPLTGHYQSVAIWIGFGSGSKLRHLGEVTIAIRQIVHRNAGSLVGDHWIRSIDCRRDGVPFDGWSRSTHCH